MNFYKKFSIGLPVISPVEEFDEFLSEYERYIENVYFSVPLGDKFHSREVTKRILREPGKKDYFAELLKTVKKHEINLELLFNTYGLSENDLESARDYLKSLEIEPDEVGFIEPYYEWVQRLFPSQKYVYSFNNFPNQRSDYFKRNNQYAQYVIGRKFIRDSEIIRQIHEHNSSVVLLLNNGCSFTCGGCGKINHCHDAYYDERRYRSYEYMYAVQSIMPFEIHEGYISLDECDYFKIASRNADVSYLKRCMDSYINNTNEVSREGDYLLWSRLSWHTDFFKYLNVNKIIQLKKEMYGDKGFEHKYLMDPKPFDVEVDLTEYTLKCIPQKENIKSDTTGIDLDELIIKSLEKIGLRKKVPYAIRRVYIGVESCAGLLAKYDEYLLETIFEELKRFDLKVAFVFPVMNPSDFSEAERLLNFWKHCDISFRPDEVVVNDMNTFQYIKDKISIPISLGRHIGCMSIASVFNSRDSEDCDRIKTITDTVKRMFHRGEIQYVMCDLSRNGIWLDTQNGIPLKVYVSNHILQHNVICEHERDCRQQCTHCSETLHSAFSAGKIQYRNNELNPDMISSIKEMRFSVVVRP